MSCLISCLRSHKATKGDVKGYCVLGEKHGRDGKDDNAAQLNDRFLAIYGLVTKVFSNFLGV